MRNKLFVFILVGFSSVSTFANPSPSITKSNLLTAFWQAYFPKAGYPALKKVEDLEAKYQEALDKNPLHAVGVCELGLWNRNTTADQDALVFHLTGRKFVAVMDVYAGFTYGGPDADEEASAGVTHSGLRIFDARGSLVLKTKERRLLKRLDRAAATF